MIFKSGVITLFEIRCGRDETPTLFVLMRTLLHNKRTGGYFQGVGVWTTRISDAFDFRFTERAILFVREAKLDVNEFELILDFDAPEFNVVLPIDDRFGAFFPTVMADPPAPSPIEFSGQLL